MEMLDYFYEKPPQFSNFVPRRYQITDKKTLIVGMKKSGITSIIADFLSTLDKKSYLYLNLEDVRVNKIELKNLNSFIKKKAISHLVIENFRENFKLPFVENIILTCNNVNFKLQGFSFLHVKPLSFEEFIGFGQRNFNTEYLFSLYANRGKLPKSANLTSFENKLYLQDNINLCLKEDVSKKLFYLLAKKQSTPYSLFQAYKELKPLMKISKDKLYLKAKELQESGFISFIQKYNSPKSAKKIYIYNFAYKNAITYKKDFIKRFENMVFSELNEEEIFYTDELHFYLPQKNQAILCIPFLPPEIIIRRFSKLIAKLKILHIKSLKVITLGNEGKTTKENIECEILPFWEWALVL